MYVEPKMLVRGSGPCPDWRPNCLSISYRPDQPGTSKAKPATGREPDREALSLGVGRSQPFKCANLSHRKTIKERLLRSPGGRRSDGGEGPPEIEGLFHCLVSHSVFL